MNFQFEVNTRKYTTLLAKERDKKEIQEGLIEACNVIDLIIEILRGSKNIKDAKRCLTQGDISNIELKSFESEKKATQLRFTERQATAILEMRLYRLIGLEIEALMKEHEQTLANIAEYEDILSNRGSMAKVIIKELKAIKKAYAVPRKTELDNLEAAVIVKKEIEVADVVLLMDRFGYVKTVDPSVYERNKEAADSENKYIFTVKNIDRVCVFTNTGQLHLIKVLDMPYGKFRDKGTPIDNLSNYDSKVENMVFIAPLEEVVNNKLIFATKLSMLKVVAGSEFEVSRKTSMATKLGDGDEVLTVGYLADNQTMVMHSKKDMFLRIETSTIPEKKKMAAGVRGMKLDEPDVLKNIFILNESDNEEIEVKGKKIALNRLRVGNRDTKGTKK